jgi:hypothetical protein
MKLPGWLRSAFHAQGRPAEIPAIRIRGLFGMDTEAVCGLVKACGAYLDEGEFRAGFVRSGVYRVGAFRRGLVGYGEFRVVDYEARISALWIRPDTEPERLEVLEALVVEMVSEAESRRCRSLVLRTRASGDGQDIAYFRALAALGFSSRLLRDYFPDGDGYEFVRNTGLPAVAVVATDGPDVDSDAWV